MLLEWICRCSITVNNPCATTLLTWLRCGPVYRKGETILGVCKGDKNLLSQKFGLISLQVRPSCSLYWGADQRKQSINQYLILDFTHTCCLVIYVVVWSQWTIHSRPPCSLYWGVDRRKRETIIGVCKGDKNILTNITNNIFIWRPSCSIYWGTHETKRSKSSFAWNISESILISAFNQVLGSGWGVRLGPAKSKVFTFQDLIALIIVRMVIIMTIISMAMTIMLVCCPTR